MSTAELLRPTGGTTSSHWRELPVPNRPNVSRDDARTISPYGSTSVCATTPTTRLPSRVALPVTAEVRRIVASVLQYEPHSLISGGRPSPQRRGLSQNEQEQWSARSYGLGGGNGCFPFCVPPRPCVNADSQTHGDTEMNLASEVASLRRRLSILEHCVRLNQPPGDSNAPGLPASPHAAPRPTCNSFFSEAPEKELESAVHVCNRTNAFRSEDWKAYLDDMIAREIGVLRSEFRTSLTSLQHAVVAAVATSGAHASPSIVSSLDHDKKTHSRRAPTMNCPGSSATQPVVSRGEIVENLGVRLKAILHEMNAASEYATSRAIAGTESYRSHPNSPPPGEAEIFASQVAWMQRGDLPWTHCLLSQGEAHSRPIQSESNLYGKPCDAARPKSTIFTQVHEPDQENQLFSSLEENPWSRSGAILRPHNRPTQRTQQQTHKGLGTVNDETPQGRSWDENPNCSKMDSHGIHQSKLELMRPTLYTDGEESARGLTTKRSQDTSRVGKPDLETKPNTQSGYDTPGNSSSKQSHHGLFSDCQVVNSAQNPTLKAHVRAISPSYDGGSDSFSMSSIAALQSRHASTSSGSSSSRPRAPSLRDAEGFYPFHSDGLKQVNNESSSLASAATPVRPNQNVELPVSRVPPLSEQDAPHPTTTLRTDSTHPHTVVQDQDDGPKRMTGASPMCALPKNPHRSECSHSTSTTLSDDSLHNRPVAPFWMLQDRVETHSVSDHIRSTTPCIGSPSIQSPPTVADSCPITRDALTSPFRTEVALRVAAESSQKYNMGAPVEKVSSCSHVDETLLEVSCTSTTLSAENKGRVLDATKEPTLPIKVEDEDEDEDEDVFMKKLRQQRAAASANSHKQRTMLGRKSAFQVSSMWSSQM